MRVGLGVAAISGFLWARRLDLRGFLTLSLIAHLAALGLAGLSGPPRLVPTERPLRVRIIDQPGPAQPGAPGRTEGRGESAQVKRSPGRVPGRPTSERSEGIAKAGRIPPLPAQRPETAPGRGPAPPAFSRPVEAPAVPEPPPTALAAPRPSLSESPERIGAPAAKLPDVVAAKPAEPPPPPVKLPEAAPPSRTDSPVVPPASTDVAQPGAVAVSPPVMARAAPASSPELQRERKEGSAGVEASTGAPASRPPKTTETEGGRPPGDGAPARLPTEPPSADPGGASLTAREPAAASRTTPILPGFFAERRGGGDKPSPETPRPSLREQLASLARRPPPSSRPDAGEAGSTGNTREPIVSLDSREDRYASYMLGVKHKIEGLWGYPPEARWRGIGGELFLVFSIAADGHLAGLELIRGSGVQILDDEALGAIRRAAPYPPFPPRMQPLGTIHITACFRYQTGYSLHSRGACS